MLLGAVGVVVARPDASDPETLTDFADIESGRIVEHFWYLGAIVLFGVAMRRTASFGRHLAMVSVGLGSIGVLGSVIAIVDPTSDASAVSVLAIAAFFAIAGGRTLRLDRNRPEGEGAGVA